MCLCVSACVSVSVSVSISVSMSQCLTPSVSVSVSLFVSLCVSVSDWVCALGGAGAEYHQHATLAFQLPGMSSSNTYIVVRVHSCVRICAFACACVCACVCVCVCTCVRGCIPLNLFFPPLLQAASLIEGILASKSPQDPSRVTLTHLVIGMSTCESLIILPSSQATV